MITSSPYFRTFTVGAVWFLAVALGMVARHPGGFSTYMPQNLVVIVGWLLTALLLGVAATRFQKMRSWWGIGLGTMGGSLVVLRLMLLTMDLYGPPAPPKFKSTDEMMVYMANEVTKWVKKDRGIDLDFSVDSIKIIEEELGRISKDIDKANPQRGTFGLSLGYGAYIGEVFRRRD